VLHSTCCCCTLLWHINGSAVAPARVAALQHPHPCAHVLEPPRDIKRNAPAARHQDAGIVRIQSRASLLSLSVCCAPVVKRVVWDSAAQCLMHRLGMIHMTTHSTRTL
jgi:hypothetical protein